MIWLCTGMTCTVFKYLVNSMAKPIARLYQTEVKYIRGMAWCPQNLETTCSQLRDISRWEIWDPFLLERGENLWCISVLAPVRRSFSLSNWYRIVRDQNRCSVNLIWYGGLDWAVVHPPLFENWVIDRLFSNQVWVTCCFLILHFISRQK